MTTDGEGCIHTLYSEKHYSVTLVVPCDKGGEIEPAQREAFTKFERAKDRLTSAAASAAYDYYLKIADEVRERVGPESADQIAPVIEKIDDLASIVTPTEFLVQQSYESDARIIGLLFDCSWEPSLGLAVKFENEHIVEVGTQDIVL
jgi:hypothetical protein